MAKFTKYNNPSRKRKHRKPDYNERMIAACKEMLIDKKLGYDIPISYYEKRTEKEEKR